MADVVYVVNKGLDIITNRILGTGTEPKFVHWGTGATVASAANTALVTPGGEARVSGTSSRVTTAVANDTYQVVGTLTCSGTAKAIVEVGLFDAVSAGNMFLRGTFDPINVNVGDSIEFTIKTQFSQV